MAMLVVVEGERDQLRGMVDMLQKEVEGLRGVKEEAAPYKGKAMQRQWPDAGISLVTRGRPYFLAHIVIVYSIDKLVIITF